MSLGQFKKGHVPFNKGKKMKDYVSETSLEKIKKTQFSSKIFGETHPSWRGGLQSLTRDGVMINIGRNKRERLSRHLFQATGKKIPNGWLVYHLDGNKDNEEIDNLICVCRKTLLFLNTKRLTNTRECIEAFLKKHHEK